MTDPEDSGSWQRLKFITRKDKQIRGAVIRLLNNNDQTILLHRPLQLLYPLEMTRQMTSTAKTSTDSDGGVVQSDVNPPDESAPAEGPAVRQS